MAEGAKILNVNDHEQTRYLVTRMLRFAGFEVTEAASGEEALRKALLGPDLIVLDIKLPDLSGFEVARMLKGREDTASIIILQTSATFVTSEKRVEGLESGADGYLPHPFDPAVLIATIRSLLRLRRAEQQLRHRAEELAVADRRKDDFLAMLAHELRNPLAAISNSLPLLDRATVDPAQARRARDVLERQTWHLARLIDDLLDVARFTRGKIDLRRGPMDVADAIAEAVSATQATFESREQQLQVHVTHEPMPLMADATRVQQVFCNLLDNASKYSERRTCVEISAVVEHDAGRKTSVVRIKDCGVGIAPEFLPNVFDLFVQADESLERTRGGMGIGLTLVKRLVKLHGGEVFVRSEGLGHGSEFEVHLPLAERSTEALPAREPARSSVTPAFSKPVNHSILLVEDNPDVADTMQALLESMGHTVQITRDGVSGVRAALEGAFSLAIVDIGLPGLNGFEVAEQIRARHTGLPLRLIALTGYGGAEQRQRALAAGFDRHLVKPVDIDALIEAMAQLQG